MKKKLFLGTLVLLGLSFLALGGTDVSNIFRLGRGDASNKRIIFNRGGSNPEIRWYESGGTIQVSNDGTAFTSIIPGVVASPIKRDNIQLAVSFAASAMTVAIKTAAGTDPSASDPAYVTTMDLATGLLTTLTITTARSIVVPSGATLNHQASSYSVDHVYMMNTGSPAGELAIAGSNAFGTGNVGVTTLAIDATSDFDDVMYSTTARSQASMVYLGRLMVNVTTPGTWAAGNVIYDYSLGRLSYLFSNIGTGAGFTQECVFDTANGHGGTNTKIRNFSNVSSVSGVITCANSAGNGASALIVFPGVYSATYVDTRSAGQANIGISLNSSQLTTAIESITKADRLVSTTSATGTWNSVTVTRRLRGGDILRPHDDGATDGSSAVTQFRVTRIGD